MILLYFALSAWNFYTNLDSAVWIFAWSSGKGQNRNADVWCHTPTSARGVSVHEWWNCWPRNYRRRQKEWRTCAVCSRFYDSKRFRRMVSGLATTSSAANLTKTIYECSWCSISVPFILLKYNAKPWCVIKNHHTCRFLSSWEWQRKPPTLDAHFRINECTQSWIRLISSRTRETISWNTTI